jgi:hypothetical protein
MYSVRAQAREVLSLQVSLEEGKILLVLTLFYTRGIG